MSFHWQTEDDGEWPDAAAAPAHEEAAANGRFSRLILLPALIALAVAGWLVYGQVQQQVTTAAAGVEADVIAAHRLVQDAVQRGDVELFRANLSGADRAWTQAQTQLVADGLRHTHPALGLTAVSPGHILTTTVSPDLQAAEIVFVQPMQAVAADGGTQTVTLQQTAVYRLGGGKWLLAPPTRAFWGDWQPIRVGRLTLSAPARDAAIARRLAADLDDTLARICADAALTCPADWRVNLRFDDGPAILPALADLEPFLLSGTQIVLPTPTLLGLPADAAAYDALRRGYSALLAAAVLPDLVGYNCCDHGPVFRVLLEKQLSRWGLHVWPLTPAAHDQAIAQWGEPSFAAAHWSGLSLGAPPLPLYTLVDFVLAGRDTAVPDLMRALSGADDVDAWLETAVGAPPSSQFEREWLAYVVAQSASAQRDAPPLPTQDVRLVCRLAEPPGNALVRYDVQAAAWHTEAEFSFNETTFGSLLPFSGENFFLLQEAEMRGGGSPEYTWTLHGQDARLARFAGVQQMFPASVDPRGQFVQMAIADWTDYNMRYELTDLTACDGDRCRRHMLDGFVSWSPNGRATLLLTDLDTWQTPFVAWRQTLLLADRIGENGTVVGEGGVPLWLDDERFAYVRLQPAGAPGDMALVTATVADVTPRVLVTADDLRPLLPAFTRDKTLYLNALGQTHRGDILLRVRTSVQRAAASYFVAVPPNGRPPALFHETGVANVPSLSPNGRWLTLWLFNDDMAQIARAELVSAETDTVRDLTIHANDTAWSDDGRWLAYSRNGSLTLTAPADNYFHVAFHDYRDCRQIDWISP